MKSAKKNKISKKKFSTRNNTR